MKVYVVLPYYDYEDYGKPVICTGTKEEAAVWVVKRIADAKAQGDDYYIHTDFEIFEHTLGEEVK